jgi:hypothetical protein
MVFPHQIDRSRRLAIARVAGTVHGHEIAGMIEGLFKDPAWEPGFDVVWDGTAVTELLLEPDDIAKLVRLHSEYAAVSPRREIVFVTRGLDRAMAQMYAVRMKAIGRSVHVCKSQAEVDTVLA